jgi:Raf kinase inhibitor-like YbhB/YbcL family protein
MLALAAAGLVACSDDDGGSGATDDGATTLGTAATDEPGDGTVQTTATGMVLTSSAFDHEGDIPQQYTCDGDDVSPPLQLSGVPQGTAGLVLIMEDPDAGGTFDHWVNFDVAVADSFPEDAGSLGTAGQTSFGRTGYGGPCPPSGTHRYFFTVYALDSDLGLAEGASKEEVLEAMDGHVLAEATLMGRYGR